MFPIINNISDMSDIEHKEEIRKMVHDDGTTTYCYMIADTDTFDTTLARECRGITFDTDGSVLHRPLHKFFNIGENESTLLSNKKLYGQKVIGILDKLDGSMITASIRKDGTLHVKSKKSPTSDVAIAAKKFIEDNEKYVNFIKHCSSINITPIFEWTSPKYPIVLQYEKDDLVLLHIRNNITGEYIDINGFDDISSVNKNNTTINDIIKNGKEEVDKEGYVIQFESGEMVKFKTQWYLDLHHVVTFVRVRDIAKSVLNNTDDDLISALALCSKETKDVIRIRDEIVNRLYSIIDEVDEIVYKSKDLTFKEIALSYNKHKYFGLIMTAARHKPVDYQTFFERNLLSEYSLEVVV